LNIHTITGQEPRLGFTDVKLIRNTKDLWMSGDEFLELPMFLALSTVSDLDLRSTKWRAPPSHLIGIRDSAL
jgi:hypothetical protein